MNKKYIAIGIALYVVSTLLSYAVFSNVGKPSQKTVLLTSPLPKDVNGKTTFDAALPKTEPCPLTGQLFSKQERDWWEKHRPLGVMIENHQDARPQSGISSADVVYEAVAEGGITRFLAIFYCQDGGLVGPVRSARTYFIDFMSEYGDKPLYTHVGGANSEGPANALGQLSDYGWTGVNDINQFSVGFPTFWRDYERLGHTVATEHTMYSTTEKLWKVAADRGLSNVDSQGKAWDGTFTPWQFKDEAKTLDRGTKSPSFDFWKGYSEYSVKWTYDLATNSYKRVNGGIPHLDKDNGNQVTVKNVIILFMAEQDLDDQEKHLLYATKGFGKALFFLDGNVVSGTWEKASRIGRIRLLDENGRQVKLDGGQIWVEILPTGTDVAY